MSVFFRGNQRASLHDPGFKSGYFHTYDNLRLGNKEHKVHIFLPRDYTDRPASPDGKGCYNYPVVYMNDGEVAFFKGGLANQSWQVAETLEHLYGLELINRVIVVAICPRDRDYDYTHEPVLSRPYGGLSAYAKYCADLKEFVCRHYRASWPWVDNLIIGSSHGGLAAFYTAGRHHHWGKVAALSPSFWVGLDSHLRTIPVISRLSGSSLVKTCHDVLISKDHPQIYLDWGAVRSGGMHNFLIERRAAARGCEMSHLLMQDYGYIHGKDLFVYEDPKGAHTELSWAQRLPGILKTFFPR